MMLTVQEFFYYFKITLKIQNLFVKSKRLMIWFTQRDKLNAFL